ncbi:hypothetical protein B4U80_09524 [Leptotrombidium deliense]|uniref:SCP domain-containing protein n=1 Tax=Leptotrombidium deliense TaxID=299467 RepID=A0A443S1W9_9ACAR|nr:hypothetical protein B4U80_09524 [Leptotrombidium deliense]
MKINQTVCEHAVKRVTELSEKCLFDHSGNKGSGYGENLAAGPTECEANVKLWTDEKPLYNSSNTEWQAEAGHYTQVVWKDSLDLCCAQASHCKYKTVTLCSYYPHGNVIGKFNDNV